MDVLLDIVGAGVQGGGLAFCFLDAGGNMWLLLSQIEAGLIKKCSGRSVGEEFLISW